MKAHDPHIIVAIVCLVLAILAGGSIMVADIVRERRRLREMRRKEDETRPRPGGPRR